MNNNSDSPDIQQIIREEVRRAVRWQPFVQLVIQVVVQGLAYGTVLIFVWQLRGQIQDILELVQSLPGAAIDSLDPGQFFGGDR